MTHTESDATAPSIKPELINLEFELESGFATITDGERVVHKHVVMRESITADLFEAEKAAHSDHVLAFNGALMGCQIVKIGEHPGPLSLRDIGTLKQHDYALIREKQMELERLGEPG